MAVGGGGMFSKRQSSELNSLSKQTSHVPLLNLIQIFELRPIPASCLCRELSSPLLMVNIYVTCCEKNGIRTFADSEAPD